MANYRPLPPLERLHEVFLLDSSSPSGLRWRVTMGSRATAGGVAGHLNVEQGYWYIKIDKKRFQAHRIAYFMYYGVDPKEKQIDHKNGDKSDNFIENLRLVSQSVNMRNLNARGHGKSGHRGVHEMKDCRRAKPYRSYIKLSSGKEMYKYFETLEDAIEQRKAWEAEYFPGIYLRED
jgi:hypothetical protein